MSMKQYFYDLLHVNLPLHIHVFRMYGLMRIKTLTQHVSPEWVDGSQLPPPQWYDSVVQKINTAQWVFIDHEQWGEATQSDRINTAAKFATMYRELKNRRPDVKFAFYAYGIKHDNTKPALNNTSIDYQTWQRQSDDYAEMLSVVDALCPSLYFWYTEADNGTEFTKLRSPGLFNGYLTDARRLLDQYGAKGRPIYPYIWWRKHDNSKNLELWIWKDMLNAVLQHANGYILWGGYQQQWNDRELWVHQLLSSMQQKEPKKLSTSISAILRIAPIGK